MGKILATTEKRAREQKEQTRELNRRAAFNAFLDSTNGNVSEKTLNKLCSEQSLLETVCADKINDILFTTYPKDTLLVLRVHHITEKYVVLEKMEIKYVEGYVYGTDRWSVGNGTGKFVKIPNKKENRNFRLAVKGISLFRLGSDGIINHRRCI